MSVRIDRTFHGNFEFYGGIGPSPAMVENSTTKIAPPLLGTSTRNT